MYIVGTCRLGVLMVVFPSSFASFGGKSGREETRHVQSQDSDVTSDCNNMGKWKSVAFLLDAVSRRTLTSGERSVFVSQSIAGVDGSIISRINCRQATIILVLMLLRPARFSLHRGSGGREGARR